MLLIVGRKIILQKGDDEAFRIIVKDAKGNEVPLSTNDIITLRMRYSMETDPEECFIKSAEIHTLLDGELVYHIMRFKASDTKDLREGDYEYDVILENENKRFTIVPKSILTIERSMSLEDEDPDRDNVLIFDADTKIDYESIVSSNPLVGSFPETKYTRANASGSSNALGAIDDEIIVF